MMPMEICKYSSSFRRDKDVSKLQYDFTQKPLPTRQAAPSLPRRRRPRRGAALHPPPPRASRAHASTARHATPLCCCVRRWADARHPCAALCAQEEENALLCALPFSRAAARIPAAPTARRVGRRRRPRTVARHARLAVWTSMQCEQGPGRRLHQRPASARGSSRSNAALGWGG